MREHADRRENTPIGIAASPSSPTNNSQFSNPFPLTTPRGILLPPYPRGETLMARADITRLNAQISTGPHPRRQTEIFFKRPPPPIRKEPAPSSSKSTNKTKQRGNRPWLRFYRFSGCRDNQETPNRDRQEATDESTPYEPVCPHAHAWRFR
jgi:hypothetical protein